MQILHECEKQAITRYHPFFFLPLWLNCAIAQLCTLSWKLIWPRNAGAESCNSIQSFAFLHKLFLHFSRTSQFSFIQSLKSFGLRLQRSQVILFPFSKKLIWGYSYDIFDIFGKNSNCYRKLKLCPHWYPIRALSWEGALLLMRKIFSICSLGKTRLHPWDHRLKIDPSHEVGRNGEIIAF